MKYLFLFLPATLLLFYACKDKHIDSSLNNEFIIKTLSATYYYQEEAGGFSSILDKDSNDWISFKYDKDAPYPKGAESMFRGLPNLVYQGKNDGVGHPGFNKCNSVLINDSTIYTSSKDSLWQYKLHFYDNYVFMDIIKTDPDQNYWFLYEGTPAGNWNPESYFWGMNIEGPLFKLPDFYKNNIQYGNWNWAYFGSKNLSTIFFIAQIESDTLIDLCGYLGNTIQGINSENGMVVFGFGRDNSNGSVPNFNKPNDFIFGFLDLNVEKENFQEIISSEIEAILVKYQ